MVRAAIEGVDAYEASTVEGGPPRPNVHRGDAGAAPGDLRAGTELHFIVGADTVNDLARWHAPAEVLARCTLVVMGRPAQGELDLHSLDRIANGSAERAVAVDLDMEVSATEIRRRAAAGESLAGLVPDAVERYIREHQLYKE